MTAAGLKLAFIGLGNIGGGAAANLALAGFDVRVVDLDPTKVAKMQSLGATHADTAGKAALGADVVFTSLPGPKEIASVGSELLAVMSPQSLWVELSTNDVATACALSVQATERGIDFVDAPVSGGPERAADGSLSIFVGGAADALDRVRPLLEIIGTKIDHVGPVGAGTTAKIAQVTLCYSQTVALVEALLLGAKGGVDPAVMLDLIQHSTGRSYVADTYGPEILAGTYDRSFPISHAAKDMRLAMELAASVGAELPFIANTERLYAETEATYGPGAAHCLAAQLLERKNNFILHEHLGAQT